MYLKKASLTESSLRDVRAQLEELERERSRRLRYRLRGAWRRTVAWVRRRPDASPGAGKER